MLRFTSVNYLLGARFSKIKEPSQLVPGVSSKLGKVADETNQMMNLFDGKDKAKNEEHLSLQVLPLVNPCAILDHPL